MDFTTFLWHRQPQADSSVLPPHCYQALAQLPTGQNNGEHSWPRDEDLVLSSGAPMAIPLGAEGTVGFRRGHLDIWTFGHIWTLDFHTSERSDLPGFRISASSSSGPLSLKLRDDVGAQESSATFLLGQVGVS